MQLLPPLPPPSAVGASLMNLYGRELIVLYPQHEIYFICV